MTHGTTLLCRHGGLHSEIEQKTRLAPVLQTLGERTGGQPERGIQGHNQGRAITADIIKRTTKEWGLK